MSKKATRTEGKEAEITAVERAKQAAARLIADAEAFEARKRKRLAKSLAKSLEPSTEAPVEEASAKAPVKEKEKKKRPRSDEGALNLACTQAKAAHLAAPTDEKLAVAYTAAKEAYTLFRRSQLAPAEMWTCELCGVSMPAKGKALHLEGKAHRSNAAKAATGDDAPARALPGFFECRMCQCTLASSAGEAHEAGNKHQLRLKAITTLWQADKMKKGDWVCTKHKVQLNYAKLDRCRYEGCDATREQGLSFDDIKALMAKEARAAGRPTVVASTDGMELVCRDCDVRFAFGAKEQTFYEQKGFAQPTRCVDCRSKKRQKVQSNDE